MEGSVTDEPGRRAEILSAARAQLAEHGFERTTVSDIARRANVAQGTFYLYFPSKAALPEAFAEILSRAQSDAVRRALDGNGQNLARASAALVEESIAEGERHRDMLLIANRGIELAPDLEVFARLTAEWRAAIAAFIQHFRDRGEVQRDLDPDTVSYALRDLLDRAVKAAILFGRRDYAAQTAELVRRLLAA